MRVKDTQVGGTHYVKYRFQPWDIIKEYGLNFWEGNVLKYLLRRKGNRLQDLQKARHYIDYLIWEEEFNESEPSGTSESSQAAQGHGAEGAGGCCSVRDPRVRREPPEAPKKSSRGTESGWGIPIPDYGRDSVGETPEGALPNPPGPWGDSIRRS